MAQPVFPQPVTFAPLPDAQAVVQLPQARFTVLTSRLIRMEYSQQGVFEDHPSQVVWNRRFPVPDFEVRRSGDQVEIITGHLHLHYQTSMSFSPLSLWIELTESGTAWHYGDRDRGNLLGTARTLDDACGPVEIEPGLLSRDGWTVIDDSTSPVFDENGWIRERKNPGSIDIYFFGYGRDYTSCLEDFSHLSGPVPLIPRWALGNWWSRYWAYTARELLDLMHDFKAHEIPLSVCIVDMDWHLEGWTGYTWNPQYFPDPPAFIDEIHRLGLKTALNLHPADGIGPHEAQYARMAAALEIDPDSRRPIPFDLEDPRFARAYFELLHHPYEDMGVDFWWMDWQQGNPCRLPGLNLLWWINHLHFNDLGRRPEKRPFIFSRWGGLGCPRYPIGFSGDTVVAWESLAFQPYFTAAAANVNFGWWSHDIGGHMDGIEDPELYTRWVQFGVFSPILRLHSTKNPFHERRPWGFDAETLRITRAAMQLRHALIPYIYSMAWLNHTRAQPLVRPMYHLEPDREEAYVCPNQYAFGTELIAAPFISPCDPDTGLARQVVWLPDGEWYNFFSGRRFDGGWHAVYGGLDEIPVFARSGAIIPTGPRVPWGGLENPEELIVHVFPGRSNYFELYEDDGESSAYLQGDYALTRFDLEWQPRSCTFSIQGPGGGPVPAVRRYTLIFHRLAGPAQISLRINGKEHTAQVSVENGNLILQGLSLRPSDRAQISIEYSPLSGCDSLADILSQLLPRFRLGSRAKHAIASRLEDITGDPALLAAYLPVLTSSQLCLLLEVLTGAGIERFQINGEDHIVLWNNHTNPQIRFQIAVERVHTHNPQQRFDLDQGVVPAFHLLVPARDFGEDQPAVVQLLYGDLLKVRLTHAMDTIYPRPQEGVL